MAAEIRTLDLDFRGQPGVIACYLIATSEGPLLVDPGPSTCRARLLLGLADAGYHPADLRAVLLTHIHLDHAGCAGWLAAQSGAEVYVHAAGAPHLADPSRLLRSAERIYGDQMDVLWGEVPPTDSSSLRPLSGDGQVQIAGLRLGYLDTPGHAKHHLTWTLGSVAFTGDVAGVRLKGSSQELGPLPPTPPPDIDLEAWRASIAKLRAQGLTELRPTHFGAYPAAGHFQALLGALDRAERLVRAQLAAGYDLFRQQREAEAEVEVVADPELRRRWRLASPPGMSVAGLNRWLAGQTQ
jgi:glyoxylase-like metal-dependent hydrolase (beta-lactamase superfamily II)